MPIMTQAPPGAGAPLPKGKRRKGLVILGIVLLVGGLGGGLATAGKGLSNYKEAVKSLARAPVGCTTTLVFDKPATFTVYAETKGKLGSLSGDCEANGTQYSHAGDKLPKVSLTLLNGNGDEVTLDRGVNASYDIDGYKGTGIRTMKIEQAGTYRLDVESDDTDFAVAIGKNPKDDSEKLLLIGGAAALVGLIFGLLFLLLGLRRRPPEAAIDIRNRVGPLPGWPPGTYPGLAPAPPSPPAVTGYQPVPVPPTAPTTTQVPGQPPVRVSDQPSGTGFAPPTFAPPSPPLPPAPDSRPSAPLSPPNPTGPQPVTPAGPPSSGGGWVVPDDKDAED